MKVDDLNLYLKCHSSTGVFQTLEDWSKMGYYNIEFLCCEVLSNIAHKFTIRNNKNAKLKKWEI